jgi:membrane protein DedA with SNARE-associated domain
VASTSPSSSWWPPPALCGDNIAYEIGHRARPWIERRFSGPKATRRFEWAHDPLARRGVGLIIVARFIPGGRTVVTSPPA